LAHPGPPLHTELGDLADLTWVDLPTGHWPMFSRPRAPAAVLVDAVSRPTTVPPTGPAPRATGRTEGPVRPSSRRLRRKVTEPTSRTATYAVLSGEAVIRP